MRKKRISCQFQPLNLFLDLFEYVIYVGNMSITVSSENFDFRLGPIMTAVKSASDIFGVYGFPREFLMRSRKTGECRTFRAIDESDPAFDHDFWDGEMQYYKPVDPIKGLTYVVVYADARGWVR